MAVRGVTCIGGPFLFASQAVGPDAPVVGTIVAGVLSVSVPYTEGADNGTEIINHDLRYRIDGGAPTTVESIGLTTPYVLTLPGSTVGHSVDVAMRTVAQDGVDEALSDWSAYSNAVTVLAPVPSAVVVDSGPFRIRGPVRIAGPSRVSGPARTRGPVRTAAR